MAKSLESLKRAAKALKKAHAAGLSDAAARVNAVWPEGRTLSHADALHVIAREAGHDSWPKLKFAHDAAAMDRAEKLESLKMALYHGQGWRIDRLLKDHPDLGRDNLGVMCALYDIDGVRAVLKRDPGAVHTPVMGPRRPILHLTFSRWWQHGGTEADMLAVAEALVAAGADVNDSYEAMPDYPVSALYGAIGHARNLALAEWLLTHGADPNDGESLYHACEFGHAEGLRLVLAHGAKPARTNALPHALDFNNLEMVEVLLAGGADPNEGIIWPEASGEAPWVIPALHQAARRMCDRAIVERLLQAGANPDAVEFGHTAYAFARICGNGPAAEAMAAAGCDTTLTPEEAAIAAAIEGGSPEPIDPSNLPERSLNLVREMIHQPDALKKVKAYVAVGLPFDHPDGNGVTPVQIAGWEGLPDVMAYLLGLGPDLTHVNAYGGDLVSTILHGSENAAPGKARDHVGCMRLALEAGVPLTRQEVDFAGDPEMSAFLEGWAETHGVKDGAG